MFGTINGRTSQIYDRLLSRSNREAVFSLSPQGPGADRFKAGGDPALQPEAPKGRFLSIIGTPTYWHIGALVAIERHAFWPNLFSSDDKQPLEVLPPFKEISDANGSLPLYQGLALDDIPARDLKNFLTSRIGVRGLTMSWGSTPEWRETSVTSCRTAWSGWNRPVLPPCFA